MRSLPATRVVNIRREPFDIYIGRPSRWGNPFRIGQDGTREEVIAKYRDWLLTNWRLMFLLGGLRGKRLGCYCAPLPCHGDVIVEILEAQGSGIPDKRRQL